MFHGVTLLGSVLDFFRYCETYVEVSSVLISLKCLGSSKNLVLRTSSVQHNTT